MYTIDSSNQKEHCYPTYGRQFNTYKWYKPILTVAICGVFYLVFLIGLMLTCLGGASFKNGLSYETIDFNNTGHLIFVLGGLAIAIFTLFLSSMIVRDRPFSSYISTRGGWDIKAFLVSLLVALLIYTIPYLVEVYKATGFVIQKSVSVSSLVLILVLGSLQCIAEEFIVRGLLMQTLGSWIRIPLAAVIASAALFCIPHAYNIYGLMAVLVSGIGFGIAAWITNGIEASCAIHIANNVPIFYTVAFGMISVSGGSPGIETLIVSLVKYGLYVLVLYILSRRTNLFNQACKDTAAEWNAKHSSL